MNDAIVKPDSAVALDDVTARAGELIELLRAIEGSRNAAALVSELSDRRARIERGLEDLLEARQARGELPAIGNVERAQLTGLVLRVEALAPGDVAVEHVAGRITASCDAALRAIEAARDPAPHDAIAQRLDRLHAAIDTLRHGVKG